MSTGSPQTTAALASPNFKHLAKHATSLAMVGVKAERFVFSEPETALMHLRRFGEMLAQDPNDEPASVLLDRIRAERSASVGQEKKRRSKRKARP